MKSWLLSRFLIQDCHFWWSTVNSCSAEKIPVSPRVKEEELQHHLGSTCACACLLLSLNSFSFNLQSTNCFLITVWTKMVQHSLQLWTVTCFGQMWKSSAPLIIQELTLKIGSGAFKHIPNIVKVISCWVIRFSVVWILRSSVHGSVGEFTDMMA